MCAVDVFCWAHKVMDRWPLWEYFLVITIPQELPNGFSHNLARMNKENSLCRKGDGSPWHFFKVWHGGQNPYLIVTIPQKLLDFLLDGKTGCYVNMTCVSSHYCWCNNINVVCICVLWIYRSKRNYMCLRDYCAVIGMSLNNFLLGPRTL